MIEILFKAKRQDNGEWIQGFYFEFWGACFILWGMTNDKPNMTEVVPETLCQYTGTTDENGNKIWENDIVIDDTECGYIKWDSYWSAFAIVFEEYKNHLYRGEVEVIGNVFDNPELLEVEK